MRKITDSAVQAFLSGQNFTSGNTKIVASQNSVKMYLHGNLIAEKTPNGLFISNCGWFSNTTKERLKGLPNVQISQKKGEWYLNGQKWNGQRIQVN